jgi:hypothetical protein
MSEVDRYIKAWGDRRARLFMLAAMIAGFCLGLRSSLWIAGLCFAGAMIGAYGYYEFRCPRCRERFLPFLLDRVELHRGRCQNCGLEKNVVPPDDGSSSS